MFLPQIANIVSKSASLGKENYMTGRVKLKGKHKRGECGSVEEEELSNVQTWRMKKRFAKLTTKKHQPVTTKK